jgi:NAD-dependent dihydropyrimidine dehydrogenase PreA subunit
MLASRPSFGYTDAGWLADRSAQHLPAQILPTYRADACPSIAFTPRENESEFGEAQRLFIDPVECIDCGACVPVCPVSAMFALDIYTRGVRDPQCTVRQLHMT